jgi:methyltransferase (TIGR00027 family)
MARPDVTFYEVDQPATQASKRARAPGQGPVYVPADATDPRLREHLVGAGFQPDQQSAFVLEGLVVYFGAEQPVADLLTTLARLGHDGSRLAVSFEQGFSQQPVTRLLAKAVYRRTGETNYFRLAADDAPALLDKAGWTVDRLLQGPELQREYLDGTPLSVHPRISSFIATATR